MLNIKRIILATLICGLALVAKAQIPIRTYAFKQQLPDSLDLSHYNEQRNFWRASGEIVGLNVGLWAFDRYATHGDWSYISLNSVKNNFKEGFKWDNDKLYTNMFLHPYNGNLFFNAARSNGYSFWGSTLFAIGGSAMWEMFMECEYPSTNDIISTPIGGICIGEVLFRTSDAIFDDRLSGWDRFGHEFAGFLVSPMRGLTRILTGDAWHRRPTSGRIFGTPNFAMEMSTGVGMLDFRHDKAKVNFGGTMKINMEYGDRFKVKSKLPYDYFLIGATVNIMKHQPVLQHVGITGRLWAKEYLEQYEQHLSLGLFQDFDFWDTDSIYGGDVPYKLGVPASFGAGLYYRDIERQKMIFDAFARVNGVILGGIASDYYRLDERNYNIASGFSIKTGINFVFAKKKFGICAKNDFYRLFTFKGYPENADLMRVNFRTLNAMGDKSDAYFSVTSVRGDWRLTKKTYLTLNLEHYFRHTNYKYLPNVTSNSLGAQLMVTYKL